MGKSNIYTKTGDKGLTSLIGGTRVSKSDVRLEAYGTIDEANSHIGMIRSYKMTEEDKSFLVYIQGKLFVAGAYLATDLNVANLRKSSTLTSEDVLKIEKEIDRLDTSLPSLQSFILPGGDPQVSACHIARTVVRRSERLIINLQDKNMIDSNLVQFVNRLSDYLFVLSRKLSTNNNCEEIPWLPS